MFIWFSNISRILLLWLNTLENNHHHFDTNLLENVSISLQSIVSISNKLFYHNFHHLFSCSESSYIYICAFTFMFLLMLSWFCAGVYFFGLFTGLHFTMTVILNYSFTLWSHCTLYGFQYTLQSASLQAFILDEIQLVTTQFMQFHFHKRAKK